MRQTPGALQLPHFPAVLLMVVADQMEDAMQHEDSYLDQHRVAKLASLGRRPLDRNRQLPGCAARGSGRKCEHVGRVIVSPELEVQCAKVLVIRQQAIKPAA